MLDTFEIISTNGVVIWSKNFSPVNPSVINNFIADTFIEEKSGASALREAATTGVAPTYKSDQHTLKWTVVKELGVIFVVCVHILSSILGQADPVAGCLPVAPTPYLG